MEMGRVRSTHGRAPEPVVGSSTFNFREGMGKGRGGSAWRAPFAARSWKFNFQLLGGDGLPSNRAAAHFPCGGGHQSWNQLVDRADAGAVRLVSARYIKRRSTPALLRGTFS